MDEIPVTEICSSQMEEEHANVVPDDVLVSVVMTTYNHANFIAQAIESVLMQKTSFSVELCIGEDESSDETRAICVAYAEKYPDKIRLFLRSRKDVIYINGVPSGRRNGLKTMRACRGRYLAILEGDDKWTDPYKLQKQVDYFETHAQCGVVCHYATVIDQDNVVLETPQELSARKLCWHHFFVGSGERKGTRHLTTMFRRKLIERFIGNEWSKDVYAGDRFLKGCALQADYCGYVIPEIMGAYRVHRGGIYSLQPKIAKLKHRISDDWITFRYVLKGYQLLRLRLLFSMLKRIARLLFMQASRRREQK